MKVTFSRSFFASDIAGNWITIPGNTAIPTVVSFSPQAKIVSFKLNGNPWTAIVSVDTLSSICISFELE